MKNGFKVFDADAHVVYPADIWERFLDKKFLHRIGRRAPAGLDTYNPVTVDGRWTQHPTILYGQFQKAINWTTEDMIDKFGEDIVMNGFTGDRVAKALEIEGVDVMVDLRPGVRPLDGRHRPASCRPPWCGPTTGGAPRCARPPAGGCTPPAPCR